MRGHSPHRRSADPWGVGQFHTDQIARIINSRGGITNLQPNPRRHRAMRSLNPILDIDFKHHTDSKSNPRLTSGSITSDPAPQGPWVRGNNGTRIVFDPFVIFGVMHVSPRVHGRGDSLADASHSDLAANPELSKPKLNALKLFRLATH